MSEITDKITGIKNNQTTIDCLLENKEITMREDKEPTKWLLDVNYQRSHVAMGMVYCKDVKAGDFPSHIHKNAREYLICAKGSFLFFLEGRAVREVKVGECVSVPQGMTHKSKPLIDDTQIAWICVPCDKGILSKKEVG